ncbi:MAG TPA: ATP-binding protein [Pyrinomonadaceae bacterium]|nr:ATP-binding protein [Pyrinomonadaceae bacterium]
MRKGIEEFGGGAGAGRRQRRRGAPWLFGSLVLLLLSALVFLQVFGLWEIFTPDTASDTLLIYALSTLNFVAFFLFAFIFVRSLLKLRRERRERQLGSRIKTRLVVYFIAVSLLPITAMALFSYMFFNRTLEKYFSPFPLDVIRQAQQAREERWRERAESLRAQANAAALAVKDDLTASGAPFAAPFVEGGSLAFVGVFDEQGRAVNFNFGRAQMTDQDLSALFRGAGGAPFFELGLTRGRFEVAAAALAGGRVLVAGREAGRPDTLSQLVARAQTFEDFKRNQRKVRMLGLSTLGLLTLMLLFAASWSAIHLARGIGAPVRALAEASREVAGGNLSHRVTVIGDDELAELASTFNDMTAQLAENRRRLEANAAELHDKNLALEERRHYIETVLQTVSTGVISLDGADRVTTINASALAMLRLEHAPPNGAPLSSVVSAEDYALLERVLWRARMRGRATEQLELARGSAGENSTAAPEGNGGPSHEGNGAGGVVPVALTATALTPREGEGGRGVVLVIEDLSELLAAQRAAAWSEVARRLAHEIKNPLTPIQLSAERIARSFRRATGENENGAVAQGADDGRVARVVEEGTATITREVEGLKAMVDEFTRFARLPHARLEPADLNEVVRQAVALYEDRLGGARMDVLLGHGLPPALLDSEQLRRVFVNLIDNSLEAMSEVEGDRRVTVATAHDPARGLLIAEVADTGQGIARSDFARLFQPYFTTRGRGTGLGLAIVNRIMTEHGGRIRAESNRPRGARMIIELPVAEEQRQEAGG